PCCTPVNSPQSKGIAEAFVNTPRQNYVNVTPLPDAIIVLALIAGWFEDDNENHPHSGLKMRSPREFIAAQSQPPDCPLKRGQDHVAACAGKSACRASLPNPAQDRSCHNGAVRRGPM